VPGTAQSFNTETQNNDHSQQNRRRPRPGEISPAEYAYSMHKYTIPAPWLPLAYDVSNLCIINSLQGLLKVSKARGCTGPGIGGTGRPARHQRSPENVRVPSSRQMAWDRRACRSDHMDESGGRARVKSANATTRSRQTIKSLLGPAWPVRNVTSSAAPAEKRGSSNVRCGLANWYISYNSAVYKSKVKLLFHKIVGQSRSARDSR
jgi:hypothetical protein